MGKRFVRSRYGWLFGLHPDQHYATLDGRYHGPPNENNPHAFYRWKSAKNLNAHAIYFPVFLLQFSIGTRSLLDRTKFIYHFSKQVNLPKEANHFHRLGAKTLTYVWT